MTFQVERWDAIRVELGPVIAAHWAEMPFDPGLPLSPDDTLYETLEGAGRLHILTAREAGQLVGYFIGFLMRHPHYDVLMGSMDIYYLLPEFRKGTNGLRLFIEYEQTMRERGAKYLLATSRLDRGVGPLFERLGWNPARTVYEKRLEG